MILTGCTIWIIRVFEYEEDKTAQDVLNEWREDHSKFDEMMDDYNEWWDYWHGEDNGHHYGDENLYQEPRRIVNGIRRFTVDAGGYLAKLLIEGLHDLHPRRFHESGFKISVISCATYPVGWSVGAGLLSHETIPDYFNSASVTVTGQIIGGGDILFDEDWNIVGWDAIFSTSLKPTGGAEFTTHDDLVLAQYYEGQFTSDIPVIESFGNSILHLLGVI